MQLGGHQEASGASFAEYYSCGDQRLPGMAVKQDPSCVYCTLPRERIRGENVHAFYIRDGSPVSPGHTLIIPRRHIASVFDIKAGEWLEFLVLMDLARQELDEEFRPDGYNIGINDGPAAGQTVPHLHLHLIPRFQGDRKDPRGGVGWIIPEKANFWSKE